ncbi:MAG: type II toxin-antitoxin system RelE/ParE family toxin [Armatimonadetes bacterium]|nr:type II toxin-antitoxin system RelE/ParE family toxin [Armatimonadota bacterium]
MVYKVIITDLASADLEDHFHIISSDSESHAKNWLSEALEKIASLSEYPLRNMISPESSEVGAELRDLLHYSHRIFYQVDDVAGTVTVVRVWHSARRNLAEKDIKSE